jgi:hypothetical protein
MRTQATVALLLLLVLGSVDAAHAAKIRIRAQAMLEARAVPRDGRVELRGFLKDDTGRAIGSARLRVSARGGRFQAAQPCGRTVAAHAAEGGTAIDTDGAGAFCVQILGASGGFRLRFDGDRYHDSVETEVEVDSSRRALALHFSPEPRVLALERSQHVIGVQTAIEPPDIDAAPESVLLELSLVTRGGAARSLTSQTVAAGEPATFTLRSADLGQPGPATLVVAFAGSTAVAAARKSAVIQRTAVVNLALAGSLGPADPSQGMEIPVAVGSALGAVPGGTVEALVAGRSVGTAPVQAGSARVIAVFDAPHAGTVPVTLRYLRDAEWWRAGEALTIPAPIAPPSPWRRLPWVIAALAIALWVVRGWRRPARAESKSSAEAARAPSGRASVDVIERGPARSGWRGRVRDAHDGQPVAGARVSIQIPAFGGGGRAAAVATDASGAFELPHVEGANAEGAQIVTVARWHSRLARPLPSPGFVEIQLVSRRRALLERLVEWAGRMGRPWSDRGEPTPGHVARVAHDRQAAEVADWAQAVERAAYGAEPPDEVEEGRVREREPDWRREAR